MAAGSGNPVIIASVGGRQRRLATPRHWRAAIEKGELGRDTSVALERGGLAAQIVTAGEIPELQDLFDEVLPESPAPQPSQPPPPPPPASAGKAVAPAPARKQKAKAAAETAAAAAGAASAQASPVDQPADADTMPVDEPAREKPTGCTPAAFVFPVLVLVVLLLIFALMSGDGEEAQYETVEEPAYEAPVFDYEEVAPEPEETVAPEPEPTRTAQPRRTPTPTPTITPTPTPTETKPLDDGNSIAQQPSLARPAAPDNRDRWARRIASDYPSRAMRRNEEGRVSVTVTINPDGRVGSCRVTASSGSDTLDSAACRGMERYARFQPALDDAGRPTTGTYSTSFEYRLN